MISTVKRAGARRHRCSFGLALALTCGLATIACAEVKVEGNPMAVRVTTSEDAIADVLSAFAATLNVQYRTAIPLDVAASKSYSGSFAQVISRLLDGYNYVIRRDQDTIEIVVLGSRGDQRRADQSPADQRYLIALAMMAAKLSATSAQREGACLIPACVDEKGAQ